MPAPLPRSFYEPGAATVARHLLGKTLVRELDDRLLRCRITETEAYIGEHDKASHARFGRTGRNSVMYGPPGHAYVYFVYGMHHMLNVVCSPEGDPQAVLVRAAEPVGGWDAAARLHGPALLADALRVTRELNGHDLRETPLWIEDGPAPSRVRTTGRIGVGYAGAWARRRLRFVAA